MTSFGRILRSGMVAVADAHRPTSTRGQFVLDKLQAVAKATRAGYERIVADEYVSRAAREQAAAAHIAGVQRSMSLVRNEVDRIRAEAEAAQDQLAAAVGRVESGVTMVGARRLERLGKRLLALPEGDLQRELTRAQVERDVDVLLAAAMEGIRGSKEQLEHYAAGREVAEATRQLAREALVLEQAAQVMSLGLDGMAAQPHAWIENSSQARPEERLSVIAGGVGAFLEVRQAQTSLEQRFQNGMQEAAAMKEAAATTTPAAEVADG